MMMSQCMLAMIKKSIAIAQTSHILKVLLAWYFLISRENVIQLWVIYKVRLQLFEKGLLNVHLSFK